MFLVKKIQLLNIEDLNDGYKIEGYTQMSTTS